MVSQGPPTRPYGWLAGVDVLCHMDGDRIANAQVRLGTSTVMVSQSSAAFPAMPAAIYLFVELVDGPY